MIDPTDDKIKLLHTAVSQKYDVGTLDEFKAKLQDPAKRKAFYDGVGKEYDLGQYSDFENKVKKKDDTFTFSLPGQINLPEPSSDGLVTAPPSPSPEQQIFTGQIPEPQSSGITLEPTKEQDKAFKEAINTKPLTFEEAGLNYEKKRKAEEKAKESLGDTYYQMYGKPEPENVISDFTKDLEQVPPAFNKGVIQAFTSIPKAVGILAQGLEKLTGWRDKPIEEYPTYQLGKVIEDKALELGLTATDPKHSNFFNSALPNAFGSMLGMMATGGMGAEAKAGIEAVPSVMGALKNAAPLMTTGAAQNAVPEFDAAKAAGMSDEQAFKVFLKNIPGGLTEAAPIIDAFGRLNKLTGNSILNVLKVGTANGLEEAAQEGVQQWATNLVAQGTYDPKRAQWDGLVESLGAAFVVGFVLPGVMTAMQSQPKALAEQVLADIHKALKNHEGTGKGVVGETIQKGLNEKPTEQGTKVSGQNVPEVKQEETVPVQAEQKKEEITNEQKGEAVTETVREPVQPVKEEPKQPTGEVGVPKSESPSVSNEVTVSDAHKEISATVKINIADGRKKQVFDGVEVKEVPYTKEDATEELEYLKLLAERGKLTPEKFSSTYFGQSTPNNALKEVAERIETDPKGFIKDLSNTFNHKSQNDAVQIDSSGKVLSGSQEGTGIEGSQRSGVELSQQGNVITEENRTEKEKQPPQIGVNPTEKITQNENPETPTQGSEVLHPESNEQAKADAIKEANDVAKEQGFDSATHLLNSLKNRTGQEYKTVQEVPKDVIEQVKSEKASELERSKKIKAKLKEEGHSESDIEAVQKEAKSFRKPDKSNLILKLDEMGLFNATGDTYSERLDLGMPTKDIRKAISDVKKGNINTAPVKNLSKALQKFGSDLGTIAGSGNFLVRNSRSLEELLILHKEINGALNAQTADTWFDQLSDTEKENLINEYEKSIQQEVGEPSTGNEERIVRSEQDATQDETKLHAGGITERLRGQIRSLRSAKGKERERIAHEIREETGKYLLNREGILVDNNGSFADRTSDTFFDLIDENKSVYLLSQDAKIAESDADYKRINEKLENKVPIVSGAMPFDDAFSSGAIDEAKKLGYDAIRLTEIDGTKGTLHILNFDKLEHVIGKDVVKERGQNLSKEPEYKEGDEVEFVAQTGQTKTGKIEGFDESKGKYKIRASNGTVWNIDAKNINVYEGEQASTKKFYEPPIGSPKKAKGKTTRVSVSPIYGADPKMLKQILIDLSKSIASKIYYAKRIAGRRRALGTYSPSNAAIHIKFQGDLDTTAHELGHSIDDVFDLLGKSNPAMEKELMELSKFGSKPKKGTANPKAYKLGEGLAEYIRAWLVNPTETQSKYPETSKVFDSTIPKETVDKMRSFGDDIRGYAGLSGHNKIMSNVQFEPEKNENWFTTLLKNRSKENFELTWFDRLGQQWTNTLLPFEKAVKFLLDKQGITQVEPSKNPVVLARLLAGENSKVQDILENGFIDSANPIDASKPNDVKLNRMIDPVSGEAMNFEWLITPLDNSTEESIKEEQKKVISYLIAKRTVEMSTKLGREDFLTGIGAGLFQDIVVAKERLAEHDSDSKETKDRIEEASRRYQSFADAGLQYAVANGRLSKEDYKTIKDANLEYVALNRISEASPDEEAVSFKKTGSKALGSVSQIVHKLKGSTKTIQNPYQSLVENAINVIKESDRNNALLAFKELAVAARSMHQGEPVNLSSIATQVGGSEDNTITIFDNGKKEYWKLDADVYKAVKNITENIKLAGWLTALPRLLRWGIIHFPVFAVRNRIRDIGSRFVISKNAFSGLDINFKKGRKQATLEAYNNAGGGQAGYYLMGEDFYNEKIEEVTRELAKDKKNILTTPDKLLHNANNWYNNLIGSGETATRLEEYRSAFKQAKEKGLDDYNAMIHAAFKARDLLDFAVAGEQMKWINQIIPFSNASVQGLRKTINSAKEDPSGFAIRFMLYAVLPTLFMRMMAHAFDRDKEYAELPDYRRDLFYNIPVGENLWITIPKPFEIGVLSSGAERIVSKIFYGDKKALEGYAGSVARSTTPIDDAALAGPARSAVEIMANYDFFRNEHIIPTEEEKMDLKLRNTESASRLGKVIGSLVASDPRYVDYLVKSNAGYFGDLAMRLSDIDRDHTRHPIDFTMTGLFRNDPVYDSKSVQHLMDEVKRLGIKSNDSFLRLFNLTLSDYFDQKDAKMKAEAGKNVRETAEFISKIWEGMKLEDIKFMEHDIKTSVRK